MKTAILLHGTEGNSDSGWLQWLGGELRSRNFRVWIPDLPHADNPSLQEWLAHIETECPFEIDSNSLIVGHSAGAVLALIIAQVFRVATTVSVGVFKDLSYLHEKLDWHANDRFFDVEFDFEKIKQHSKHNIFVHSDNDPYCPLEQAEYLCNKLGGTLKIFEGQGHFNTESDPKYKKFPELLELIESEA